jgi:predicted phosphodiesterase
MAAARLDPAIVEAIRKEHERTGSAELTAHNLGLSSTTVRKYLRNNNGSDAGWRGARTDLPSGKHEQNERAIPPETPGRPFPDAHHEAYLAHAVDTPGMWLILSDIHVPYHDRTTIELAVAEAKRRNVVGVILNGDTLDSHEVSRHDKDPSAPRYIEEIETAKSLLAWLRGQLPRAELVLKEGNHEERLDSYIIQRAPALFGLEGIDLPSLLHLRDYGAAWVTGRRVITLGRLNVIHGHEFPGGCTSPVNPARGLYLKARSVAICGHHHQSSEHHARNIRGRAEAAWSLGCACFLSPRYMPLNNWNHGFAFVEVAQDGQFSVENKRVFSGKIV